MAAPKNASAPKSLPTLITSPTPSPQLTTRRLSNATRNNQSSISPAATPRNGRVSIQPSPKVVSSLPLPSKTPSPTSAATSIASVTQQSKGNVSPSNSTNNKDSEITFNEPSVSVNDPSPTSKSSTKKVTCAFS
jgi:hypothetical protein